MVTVARTKAASAQFVSDEAKERNGLAALSVMVRSWLNVRE